MSQTKKILIIDDEEDIVDLIADQLEEIESNVYTIEADKVSKSTDALAMLRSEEKYDLVVSDLNMPGLDGIELLSMIRKTDGCTNQEVPFLLVSGYLNNVDPASCSSTFNDVYFLEKPFSAKRMQGVVQEWLRKYHEKKAS